LVGEQQIALVTGANKGIGLEVARGLATHGMTVFMGARQPSLGEAAVAILQAEGHDVRFVELDVTRLDLVTAARQRIDSDCGRLDVLVNNAAGGLDSIPPSQVSEDDFRHTLETNVIGPFRVLQVMLPLLRRSSLARIVNVSSDYGSLSLNADPTMPHANAIALAYPASKAALNQMTVQFAKEFRGSNIKINSANPGFTDTDMINRLGMSAGRTPAQGAKAIIALALIGPDGPSGGFFDDRGTVPW